MIPLHPYSSEVMPAIRRLSAANQRDLKLFCFRPITGNV